MLSQHFRWFFPTFGKLLNATEARHRKAAKDLVEVVDSHTGTTKVHVAVVVAASGRRVDGF